MDFGAGNYRQRYYSPDLGRFTSEDPSAFGAGLSLYSYTNNSPTNHVDPFGLRVDKNFFIKGVDIGPTGVDAWEVAENLPRKYGKGFYIAGHGYPRGAPASAVRDENQDYLSPQELAKRIRTFSNWKKCDVVLLACNTGMGGESSYAQTLARELEVTVFAPDGEIDFMKAIGPPRSQYAGITAYRIEFRGGSKMVPFKP